MWKCKRCGKCCKYIIIPVQEPVDMETESYLESHGIAYEVSMTSDGFNGKLIVPAVCRYLSVVNGYPIKYKCLIHTDKYANCRLGGEKECIDAQKSWKILEEMKR